MARTLLNLFDRFSPSEKERGILERATVSGPIRAEKEMRIVEVTANFPMIIPKNVLYDIEDAISRAYNLRYVRIYPKYKSELFTSEYFPEIMTEARRRDIISENFLRNYKAEFSGDAITVKTGFGVGGVNILNAGNTASKISEIISSEFGVYYKIKFDSDSSIDTGVHVDMDERLAAIRRRVSQNNAASVSVSTQPTNAKSSFYDDSPETTVEGEIIKAGYMKFSIEGAEIIFGEDFDIIPSKLHDSDKIAGEAVFVGVVMAKDVKARRRGNIGVSFCIHDGNAALSIRVSVSQSEASKYDGVRDDMAVAIRGTLAHDEFDGELILIPSAIKKIKKIDRTDTAPEKRVELHLHTTMSTMDAIIPPDVAVKTAKAWGHRAIAITDHGNVQGFQEAAKAAKEVGMKIQLILAEKISEKNKNALPL